MLKVETKRKLNIALAAAARSAALRGNFSEGGACGVEVHAAAARAAPIRMVQEVEGFSAELESHAFADREGFEDPEVPIVETGLIDDVADVLCVEGSFRRRGENRRVEPLAGAKIAENIRSAVLDPVLAVYAATEVRVEADAGVVVRGGHAARAAGLSLNEARYFPPAQGLARKAALVAKERQGVHETADEVMAGVELGRPPQKTSVVRIGGNVAVVRAVIHALRQRVGEAEK